MLRYGCHPVCMSVWMLFLAIFSEEEQTPCSFFELFGLQDTISDAVYDAKTAVGDFASTKVCVRTTDSLRKRPDNTVSSAGHLALFHVWEADFRSFHLHVSVHARHVHQRALFMRLRPKMCFQLACAFPNPFLTLEGFWEIFVRACCLRTLQPRF